MASSPVDKTADKTMKALAAFDAKLDPDLLALSNRLRRLVREAAPELAEDFKWNAPSFRKGDTHCVTLGLLPKGGLRLVLHRGAKPRDTAGFRFDDPDGLASWPAPDRGTMSFARLDELEAIAPQLAALVRRWVDIVS